MEPREENQPAEPAFLTEVRDYVDYWVPQLRLPHWYILVREAPHDAGVFAQIRVNPDSWRAVLEVRDPKYTPDDNALSDDLEVSTVHELLHLRFSEGEAIIHGTHKELPEEYERSIEHTAMALVAARRGVPVLSLYD